MILPKSKFARETALKWGAIGAGVAIIAGAMLPAQYNPVAIFQNMLNG